jgi:hypothetical protein
MKIQLAAIVLFLMITVGCTSESTSDHNTTQEQEELDQVDKMLEEEKRLTDSFKRSQNID